MRKILVLAVLGALFGFKTVSDWKIKNSYAIKFKHEDAEGVFKSFSGKLIFDESNPADAVFDIAIDVKSVETGNPMKDESIASDSWLNADKFPQVKFKSKGAKKVNDKWETTGTLFIHGVEKEVSIPFTFSKKEEGGLFESNFSLAFIDYKLSDDSAEKITLDLKVPVGN